MSKVKTIKHKPSKIRRKNVISYLLMIAPAFVILTIFAMVPLVMAVVRSFQDYLTQEPTLANYDYIFSSAIFKNSFKNVLIIGGSLIILQFGLGFLYAFLLTKLSKKVAYIIRLLIYIPNLISPVLVSIVFNLLLNSGGGLFASLAYSLGRDPIHFTIDGIWPYVIIIGAALWGGFGYTTLVMYAGLLSIPKTYYEAADIDGVNGFQKMFKITIPCMRNAIILSLVGQITGALQMLDIPLFMTGGGPMDQTMTPALYLFTLFKSKNAVNYAIAGSIIVLIVIVALNVVAFNLVKSKRSEDV